MSGVGPEEALAPWRARWGLVPEGEAFATASSVLQAVRVEGRTGLLGPGDRGAVEGDAPAEGRPAFLKLATSAEEAAGGRVLRWWAGRGAARVLAADGDAVLLERAGGAGDLGELAASGAEGDDAATRILCRAGLALHRVDGSRPEGLVGLPEWFRELFAHAEAHPERHGGLFRVAAETAAGMLARPLGDVVLHGDLHHGNVLDFGTGAGAHDWRAIDPKPLHGDPAFDFANILCNPDERIAGTPGRAARTVRVIAAETGVDERRMLRWALAWTGLSAAWTERDGGQAGAALAAAAQVREALGV